jgi:hypothetical protein
MSSGSEGVETIEPDQLIPGRRASQARVIGAGLTDDDIDGLIKQATRGGRTACWMSGGVQAFALQAAER